jgi:multidrug efflux pump subunit AcrB
LAETQILQEWVETEYRGTINALQESASKAFAVVFLSMLLFMIPVVSYDESFDDLHALMMLVTVSIMTTVVAAFGFTWWYYRYCNEGWYRGIE